MIAYRKEPHFVDGQLRGYFEHRDYIDVLDTPAVLRGGQSPRRTDVTVAPVTTAAAPRPCRGCGQATCQCPPPAPTAAQFMAAFQRKAAQLADAGVPVPPVVPVPAPCTVCHVVPCRCQDMLAKVVACQVRLGRRG